jgi:hypothetical protein
MYWDAILNFVLDTKYAQIAEMKESLQDIVIAGIN